MAPPLWNSLPLQIWQALLLLSFWHLVNTFFLSTNLLSYPVSVLDLNLFVYIWNSFDYFFCLRCETSSRSFMGGISLLEPNKQINTCVSSITSSSISRLQCDTVFREQAKKVAVAKVQVLWVMFAWVGKAECKCLIGPHQCGFFLALDRFPMLCIEGLGFQHYGLCL